MPYARGKDRIANSKAYHARNRSRIIRKQKARYRKDKKRVSIINRSWREKNVARLLWNYARARSELNGWPFNLTVEDVVVPKRCPIFNKPLSVGVGSSHDFSPTLDRIDPKKFYTKGNVAVISRLANNVKGFGSLRQLRLVIKWLEGLK